MGRIGKLTFRKAYRTFRKHHFSMWDAYRFARWITSDPPRKAAPRRKVINIQGYQVPASR